MNETKFYHFSSYDLSTDFWFLELKHKKSTKPHSRDYFLNRWDVFKYEDVVLNLLTGCMIWRQTVHSNSLGGSSGLSVSFGCCCLASLYHPSSLHSWQAAQIGSWGCKHRRWKVREHFKQLFYCSISTYKLLQNYKSFIKTLFCSDTIIVAQNYRYRNTDYLNVSNGVVHLIFKSFIYQKFFLTISGFRSSGKFTATDTFSIAKVF